MSYLGYRVNSKLGEDPISKEKVWEYSPVVEVGGNFPCLESSSERRNGRALV